MRYYLVDQQLDDARISRSPYISNGDLIEPIQLEKLFSNHKLKIIKTESFTASFDPLIMLITLVVFFFRNTLLS